MGFMGLSDARSNAQYDLNAPAIYAELAWDEIAAAAQKMVPKYIPVPKFPAVRRDLSLLINQSVTFQDIEKVVRQTERKMLQKIGLFDIYRGDKTGPDKKSYAISLWFSSHEKTLTDQELEKVMQRICAALSAQVGAVLR
jgi:phenylalanyl-tRNA synthetase beta chain